MPDLQQSRAHLIDAQCNLGAALQISNIITVMLIENNGVFTGFQLEKPVNGPKIEKRTREKPLTFNMAMTMVVCGSARTAIVEMVVVSGLGEGRASAACSV